MIIPPSKCFWESETTLEAILTSHWCRPSRNKGLVISVWAMLSVSRNLPNLIFLLITLKQIVPSNLGITNGTNATIQVVTNGDPNGGLYNCADIIFTSNAPTPSQCNNGTGVTTTAYNGPTKNVNGTNPGPSTVSGGANGSATPSATAKSGAGTLGGDLGDLGSGSCGCIWGGHSMT